MSARLLLSTLIRAHSRNMPNGKSVIVFDSSGRIVTRGQVTRTLQPEDMFHLDYIEVNGFLFESDLVVAICVEWGVS